MVEPTGIEPVTSCLQGRCSTKIELRPHIFVFVCPKRQASFPLCQLHLIGTGIATYQISCVATPTGLEPVYLAWQASMSNQLHQGAKSIRNVDEPPFFSIYESPSMNSVSRAIGDTTGSRTPVTGETVRHNNLYMMAPNKILKAKRIHFTEPL